MKYFKILRAFLFSFLLLATLFPSFSQVWIKGKVLNISNKIPIPYANIGIANSTIGTISNEDGSFSVYIPLQHLNDTLLFSTLGFGQRAIPIASFAERESQIIYMTEKSLKLETVLITAKKLKKKTFWLGNSDNNNGVTILDSISAGGAIAILIKNDGQVPQWDISLPVYVEKALLKIEKNTLEQFKIRVRLLEVDSITQLPGKDLFNESKIITSSIKNGWLEFDLSEYNIKVKKTSFFLTFESILEEKDRLELLNQYREFRKSNPKKVIIDTMVVDGEKTVFTHYKNFTSGTYFGVYQIPLSFTNYKCFSRKNSFGEWKRIPSTLSAKVLLSSFPQPENKKEIKIPTTMDSKMPCSDQSASCKTVKNLLKNPR